jgi:hypothetical protein
MNGYGLISEEKETMSLGRVTFWIVLLYMSWFWFSSEYEIPSTLITTFEWVMGYNFGKKILSTITAVKG